MFLPGMHFFILKYKMFFSYDYENVDAGGANLMMCYLDPLISGYSGMKLSANDHDFIIEHADNYEYVDPIDGSVAQNQVY